MKIKITKEETDFLMEGEMTYLEGKCKQEGKPSFFIATDKDFEVDFSTENIEEIDRLINDLQEIRQNIFNSV